MSTNKVACPIPPVDNEVREGVIVYAVPEQFHASLAKVMIARRVLNARAAPLDGGTYFMAMQQNESEYSALLSEMRSTLRVPDEALFEFYSNWRFSITTLENEKILYEQGLAKKKPEEMKLAGGPTLEYMRAQPQESSIHLARVFVSCITFEMFMQHEQQLRLRRKQNAGPS